MKFYIFYSKEILKGVFYSPVPIWIFLVRWPTAALISKFPIPYWFKVCLLSPKWLNYNLPESLIELSYISFIMNSSDWFGSDPEGPITIRSPTIQLDDESTVIVSFPF